MPTPDTPEPITPEQVATARDLMDRRDNEIVHHALGLRWNSDLEIGSRLNPYRNHYTTKLGTDNDRRLKRLVLNGVARYLQAPMPSPTDVVYRITPLGSLAIGVDPIDHPTLFPDYTPPAARLAPAHSEEPPVFDPAKASITLPPDDTPLAITIQLTPAEEGGYTVTCDQIPELVTQGETIDEALGMAADAYKLIQEAAPRLADDAPDPPKPHTYAVGDKVEIVNNDHEPIHCYPRGTICEVTSLREGAKHHEHPGALGLIAPDKLLGGGSRILPQIVHPACLKPVVTRLTPPAPQATPAAAAPETPDYKPGDKLRVTGDTGNFAHGIRPGTVVVCKTAPTERERFVLAECLPGSGEGPATRLFIHLDDVEPATARPLTTTPDATRDVIADPQPAPSASTTSQPVEPALIDLIRRRSAEGRKRYGTSLNTHNGRSAEIDALQESLDLNQYLMQRVLELTDAKAHLESRSDPKQPTTSDIATKFPIGTPVVVLGDTGGARHDFPRWTRGVVRSAPSSNGNIYIRSDKPSTSWWVHHSDLAIDAPENPNTDANDKTSPHPEQHMKHFIANAKATRAARLSSESDTRRAAAVHHDNRQLLNSIQRDLDALLTRGSSIDMHTPHDSHKRQLALDIRIDADALLYTAPEALMQAMGRRVERELLKGIRKAKHDAMGGL